MYSFKFDDKEYELREDNFLDFFNDEEYPVSGFEVDDAIRLLNEEDNVEFEIQYYDQPCENCYNGEKQKSYSFLEHDFYIFTKEGNYVSDSISCRKENTTLGRLARRGKVDNSYFVKVTVCRDCGEYSIEIEECGI